MAGQAAGRAPSSESVCRGRCSSRSCLRRPSQPRREKRRSSSEFAGRWPTFPRLPWRPRPAPKARCSGSRCTGLSPTSRCGRTCRESRPMSVRRRRPTTFSFSSRSRPRASAPRPCTPWASPLSRCSNSWASGSERRSEKSTRPARGRRSGRRWTNCSRAGRNPSRAWMLRSRRLWLSGRLAGETPNRARRSRRPAAVTLKMRLSRSRVTHFLRSASSSSAAPSAPPR